MLPDHPDCAATETAGGWTLTGVKNFVLDAAAADMLYVLADTGCGTKAFDNALATGGIALIAEQAGGAHRAMQLATDYAKTRFQFGRAIGSFQAVKHMCADMLLEAESAISAARHVAAAFASADADRRSDLALAQSYYSDAFVFVAATGIQVHGGIGFTWEHPAHL